MTYIYYTSIEEERHALIIKDFSQNFPEIYQNKIEKFRKWQDAQLSVLGIYLLRYGLKKIDKLFDEKKLRFNLNSKPYFESRNLEFNISHSGNMVVCAISDSCEIGIDVEILKDIKLDDFKSQLTENEWNKIFYADDVTSSFFDYWTQKEAVLKAHGSGIIDLLQSFEVIDKRATLNHRFFFIQEISIEENYKCHIAFNEKMETNILKPAYIDSLILF